MSGLAFDGGGCESAPAAAAAAAAAAPSIGDDARRFCGLPEAAQRSLLGYPELVRAALLGYAAGDASAEAAVRSLIEACPEMLATVDNLLYRESPLGQALLRKRADVCWEFVRLAERHGIVERILRHRNSSGHTLLMLAVDLDREEDAPLLERLLREWPEQVHSCYDSDGRNVLHHCAVDGRGVSLRVILRWLLANVGDVAGIVAALGVPDGVDRLTPLHHMAGRGRLDMLQAVAEFGGGGVDFDRRWPPGSGRTPLMLAAASGSADVCRWLVRSAGADPRAKSPTSAVELAEAAGRTEAAAALRELLLEVPPTAVSSSSSDEFEDDDDDDVDDVKEDDDVADKIGRLRVFDVGDDAGRLSESTRRRLSEALLLRLRGADATPDAGRQFVAALAARWPPLARAEAAGFLGLSADPPALCVSLMAGSGAAGLAALADALRDIGRADLVPLMCEGGGTSLGV